MELRLSPSHALRVGLRLGADLFVARLEGEKTPSATATVGLLAGYSF